MPYLGAFSLADIAHPVINLPIIIALSRPPNSLAKGLHELAWMTIIMGSLIKLIPTYPDRNAGLGFLANTVSAFMLLAAAHGTLVGGQIANRILYLGAALPDFKAEIAVLAIFLLCVVCGPLRVFAPQLAQAKRTGNREYGILAERYVRDFDAKWLRGGGPADEPFLGTGDIQSLADLGNSLEVVRTMRITPVTKEGVLGIMF